VSTVEIDRSGRADHLHAAHREQIRQQIDASGIPILGLSGSGRPADERFGGVESFNDTVTTVRIVYGEAVPGGPWASVDTSRWVGTPVSSGPLRAMVEHNMRMCGDRFSAVEWTDGDATVLVDSQPVAGRIVRAGGRWWAARCEHGDLEISVVARDWEPDTIAVDTITDPVPMLSRTHERPHPARPPQPEPVPEGLGREPHRVLVDAALREERQRAAWLADGGPVPELPRYWSALWQATVERQMDLAGTPEPAARHDVGSIVSQLTSLQHEAEWFRDDGRLRERAIAETLLYGTGLGDRVPSRAAQMAWLRRESVNPPEDRAGIESTVAADRQWIDAWTAWAHDQAQA
jgi:hypothetical protein